MNGPRRIVGTFPVVLAIATGSLLPSAAVAGVPEGLAWLRTQPNPDGSFGGKAASLATPHQSTAELVGTYHALGLEAEPAYAGARSFASAGTESNTESLARRALVSAQAGLDATALVAELLRRQNADGGFGEQEGYASSVLDTAMALEALAALPQAPGAPLAVSYLVSRQHPDGGFADGANLSSVYLSALALRPLARYRFALAGASAAAGNAQAFLLAARDPDTWGETHLTALALVAILPSLVDLAPVSTSLAALAAGQLADGSWEQDAYTTVLALRALHLASLPRRDPTLGAVGGRILDAETGEPLAGVTVSVSGPGAGSAQTAADGRYLIVGVQQGGVSLSAARVGYLTATGSGTVVAGATLGFSAALNRDPQPVPIVLRGLVVDGASGAPLAGATARVPNTAHAARTGADGRFELGEVPAGSLQLEVLLTDYAPAAFAVSAPSGGVVELGRIGLVRATSGATGTLAGNVADALSGQPLLNVLVSLSGADNRSTFTDARGAFAMTGITPGAVGVTASLAGYESAAGAGTIVAGATLRFDARLVRRGNPERTTVTGSVVEAGTRTPLLGVLVSVNGGVRSALSASDGSFAIADVPAGPLSIELSLADHVPVTYAASAPHGGLLALGVVALAPTPPAGEANRIPIVSSRAPEAASAGQPYVYNVVASDPDGDALGYALEDHPAGMTIDPANGRLTWIPTADQLGPQAFTAVVIDARAGVGRELATVNVSVGASRSYVITDLQTLSGLSIDDRVPDNYSLGTYVRGAVPGFVVGAPPCPIGFFTAGGSLPQALNALERLTAANSLGAQPGPGSDLIVDLQKPYASVTVFPQIDNDPIPQEGIEYTVWGSDDPDAAFPDGWHLGTLMAIYRQGYVVSPSCAGQNETDDFAGLYTFGAQAYRYLRVRADSSITIFDTPAHTSFSGVHDQSGLPGWQSSEGQIDAVAGMACDVAPHVDAGPDIVGRTGQAIAFDATASDGNLRRFGWDLDGDGSIDLTVARPSYVFDAAFDGDVTLLALSDRGCVGVDTVHVTIALDLPRPDLTVSSVSTDAVVTDLQTLRVFGSVQVGVRNLGTVGADRPAAITVFEDLNGNGTLDPGADTVLGSLTMPTALGPGAALSVGVPVSGTVSFRDVALYAMADSDLSIDEAREDNNLGFAASLCRIPPQTRTLIPALKWEWKGSSVLPEYNLVMSAPVVAPLEDTNGDGRVDHDDVPAVIFQSFRSFTYNSDGVLRALSGRDGHELWTVTDPAYRTIPAGNIAVADLDGDGVVEIVAPRQGSGMIAFDHTGAFVWQSAVPTSLDWGGPAIADLDGDGRPEIVVGHTVLNGDGSLRWQGTGFNGGNLYTGPLSIVADINLDGRPEVVAGGAAYSDTGQLLWQNSTAGDGLAAVGNFNADPYPEIVVVRAGRVSLLDHNGNLIWGPVAIPEGGAGGPPTIADFDGDGTPEIGVAAAQRYAVFKADGSLMWSAPIVDGSSSVTGSSVFDFDGDGQSEVVYADEQFLRIYRGTNGAVLFEVRNISSTALELPVVADVDADGHADIVVCANGVAPNPSITGIRVYTDANNSWVPTRRIWNQHSYHITNIDPDGRVPAHELNSWQVHNSYRLNALVGVDLNALPDLTASRLQLTAGVGGQPVSLSVRIGNAGGAPSGPTTLAFYEGDPASGGLRIGSVPVPALAAGAYQDVTLVVAPNVSGATDLYAVVDEGNLVQECREANNTVRRAVGTQSLFADLSVGTDAPAYGAHRPVSLQASVTNLSALPGAFRVQLQVEDGAGVVVALFEARDTGTLPGGAAVSQAEAWNTGALLAGPYRLRGRLLGLSGALLDEAVAMLSVVHDAGGASAVRLRTTTDRPTYHTTDRVEIEDLVANMSANTLVSGAVLRVEVVDPRGATLLASDTSLAELGPGAVRSVLAALSLDRAPIGRYEVRAALRAPVSQELLAEASASFQVMSDLRQALQGVVELGSPRLAVGRTQTCTDRVINGGTALLLGLELRHVLADLDAPAELHALATFADLTAGAADLHSRSIDTAALPAGNYACLLQARIDGVVETLAFAPFILFEEPTDVAVSLEAKGKGRLLVLVDGPHSCRADCGREDHDHGGEETEHAGREADDDVLCDDDPHGPRSAPGLASQRAFLRAALREAGWSFTIVNKAADFARKLRTGTYSVYALLAEDVTLDKSVQKELREAVFRGEGLLVTGVRDDRHQILEDALGVALSRSVSHAVAVDLRPGLPGASGRLPLIAGDHARLVRRRGAKSAGVYVFERSGHGRHEGRDLCRSQRDGSVSRDHDVDDDDDDDDDCDAGLTDAVTVHDYGRGRSVFAGFDLLAAATQEGGAGRAADLLRAALEAVQPAVPRLLPRAVVPITVQVDNRGLATLARAGVTVSAGARIVAALGGSIADGRATWELDLAKAASVPLVLWIELPPIPSPVTVDAVVMVLDSTGGEREAADASLALTVETPADGNEARCALDALIQAGGPYSKPLQRARQSLERAMAWPPGRPDKALRDALQAADELAGARTAGIDAARRRLDDWIRILGQSLIRQAPTPPGG